MASMLVCPLSFPEEIKEPARKGEVQRNEEAKSYNKMIYASRRPPDCVPGLCGKEWADVIALAAYAWRRRKQVMQAVDEVHKART